MGCQDEERRAAAARTDLDSSSSRQQQRGDLGEVQQRLDVLATPALATSVDVANRQLARKSRLDVGGSADKEMAASKRDLREEGKKTPKVKMSDSHSRPVCFSRKEMMAPKMEIMNHPARGDKANSRTILLRTEERTDVVKKVAV
ncbi:hypothetical protein SASPL_151504 [Salvia splendens]|uniref:Uncharacterized protein n=1 Tax=Salvia splendens TaxID=180675 RepID=A0A8X8Z319_SALSN|nr:hypothetical protein SASPL_151504 [Salvia splendens]